jgi:hypothetical protein
LQHLTLSSDGYPRVLKNKIGYDSYRPWGNRDAYVKAHIAIIEYCLLGCMLPKGFEIHHRRHNKQDFRLCSLALLTKNQHHIEQRLPHYYCEKDYDEMQRENVEMIRKQYKGHLRPLLTEADFYQRIF